LIEVASNPPDSSSHFVDVATPSHPEKITRIVQDFKILILAKVDSSRA
jgi:hypothetical protein